MCEALHNKIIDQTIIFRPLFTNSIFSKSKNTVLCYSNKYSAKQLEILRSLS